MMSCEVMESVVHIVIEHESMGFTVVIYMDMTTNVSDVFFHLKYV